MGMAVRTGLATLFLIGLAGAGAFAGPKAQSQPVVASAPDFVAHRAVYDLQLDTRRQSSGVETMRGRIVYDFSGNECEGYATKFRQVTEIGLSGGGTNMSDMRSTTFEDEAGRNFSFSSQNFTNQKPDGDVDGQARREADGAIAVALKKPTETKFDLARDVLFPTGQMKAIVAAAQAGDNIFESKVYDGSDGGRKVYATLAVIGKKAPAARPAEGAAANARQLANIDRWPVTVSYFDPSKKTVGEEMPVYTMSFDLYANGISNNIVMDYGDFRLKGTMASLDFLPQTQCSK